MHILVCTLTLTWYAQEKGGWVDGWMDGLSIAGGSSLGPRHEALVAQLPHQQALILSRVPIFGGVQTKVSWRSPLTSQYSR